tara:strand:+ start:503 stop:1459 length:957 start_codon:yes stop_codon:yes gene_type:complete
MQTRESVMKKIILICLFGLILSDTIIYSENGKEYKIENIKIKDQNEKYIKYSNWEGVKAINTNQVISILDNSGNEIFFSKVDLEKDIPKVIYSGRDVVYLKNGSIIKGLILEQIPNKSLKIETADGSLFVFEFDQISKISKEIIEQTKTPVKSPEANNVDVFSYNNIVGALYVPGNNSDIFAINFSGRLENDLSLGLYYSSYYRDSSLPGQVTSFLPYFAWDLTNSNKIVTQIIMGGKYTIRDWSSSNASGSLDHFGLVYGLGVNVKILKNIGIGIVAAMAEDFYFVAYNNGTSEITSEDWVFTPVVTLNLYDLFPSE